MAIQLGGVNFHKQVVPGDGRAPERQSLHPPSPGPSWGLPRDMKRCWVYQAVPGAWNSSMP